MLYLLNLVTVKLMEYGKVDRPEWPGVSGTAFRTVKQLEKMRASILSYLEIKDTDAQTDRD